MIECKIFCKDSCGNYQQTGQSTFVCLPPIGSTIQFPNCNGNSMVGRVDMIHLRAQHPNEFSPGGEAMVFIKDVFYPDLENGE